MAMFAGLLSGIGLATASTSPNIYVVFVTHGILPGLYKKPPDSPSPSLSGIINCVYYLLIPRPALINIGLLMVHKPVSDGLHGNVTVCRVYRTASVRVFHFENK